MSEFSNEKKSVVSHSPSIYAEEMSTQSVVVSVYDTSTFQYCTTFNVPVLHYF